MSREHVVRDGYDYAAAWDDPATPAVHCSACGALLAKRLPVGSPDAGYLFDSLTDGSWTVFDDAACFCGVEEVAVSDPRGPVSHQRLSVLEQAERVVLEDKLDRLIAKTERLIERYKRRQT